VNDSIDADLPRESVPYSAGRARYWQIEANICSACQIELWRNQINMRIRAPSVGVERTSPGLFVELQISGEDVRVEVNTARHATSGNCFRPADARPTHFRLRARRAHIWAAMPIR